VLLLSPTAVQALCETWLNEAEQARLAELHYHDEGHGFDRFGMHPAFVGLGQLLTKPLYERYFRVISRGHGHIPQHGPAILACNHSGSIPIDGAMLWADVVRNSTPPRVPRGIADHFVPALPWVGTLFARCGMVGGSRGNVRTLLEQGELLMIFPEGVPGIVKPWRERYKLQTFRVGHAELAIRHGAPIVPVGIIGAEEQMPQLFSSRRLGKLVGVPVLPVPITPVPLPVRYRIFYGPPIQVQEEFTPDQADDPQVIGAVAERVKAAVHELLQEGLAEREGVFT
jgi:1-acyl-sn-glycerol-3-phosphate acyltransferase